MRVSSHLPFACPLLFACSTFVATFTPDAAVAGGGDEPHRYQYLSPAPGSQRVSPWNNIVLRFGDPIDRTTLDARRIRVTGARSGPHPGNAVLSDDGRTIVFTPRQPFSLDERVAVDLEPGIRALSSEILPALAFEFQVATADPKDAPRDELARLYPESFDLEGAPAPSSPVTSAADLGCGLPADYPPVLTLKSNQPEPGLLFMAPFQFADGRGRMMIVDNNLMPIFYRGLPTRVFDFKRQPSGLLTGSIGNFQFLGLDSSYAVVDTFVMGNGYQADGHELVVLPNGHALMLGYDVQPMRMDLIVPGGNPNAQVIGLIVQEIDTAGNVVLQWRSWDHFQITDADTCLVNLRSSLVDYVHGNAIAVDLDGNLLVSSRHMHEITKIDRLSASVIWRLGLHAKNNQFVFEPGARGWKAQHHISVLPNGHYTLFDNGNCQDSLYSRALEYNVNAGSMTAVQVWQYRNTPDTFGPILGSVQRLPGGGTLIGWGGTGPDPKVTEVRADGTEALELGLLYTTTFTYRAFRFPWEWKHLKGTPDTLQFGTVNAGNTALRPLQIKNLSAFDFTISCMPASHGWYSIAEALPIVVPAGAVTNVTVRFRPQATGHIVATLYARFARDTEVVAQPVAILSGSGLGTTAADDAERPLRFALHPARPSPFVDETTIRFDLARPDWVSLEVFDLQGRKVDTLVEGFRPAGRHEASWRSRESDAGVYFYRLRAGNLSASRRFVLVK